MTEFFNKAVPKPSHWRRARFKWFSNERNEYSVDGDEPLLSVSEYFGVAPRAERHADDAFLSRAETLKGYRVVQPGDLVVNYMLAWKGAQGVSGDHGLVSPAYSVLELDREKVDPRYVHYLVRSGLARSYFRSESTGIIESRLRLYPERLAGMSIMLPALEDQCVIAAYLDRETARIEALIEKKQRLIELLEEKLAAAVETCLPRRSGLGAPKLGFFADVLPGYAFRSDEYSHDPADVRLLRGVNVGCGRIEWADEVRWDRGRLHEVTRFVLEAGDIVMGLDRPWISSGVRVAVVSSDDLPALLLQRVARIRPKEGLYPEYLRLVLECQRFAAYCEPGMTGVSVPHISTTQIEDFRLDLPSFDEQLRIAEQVAALRTRVRAAQAAATRSIDLLAERRSALITAAVTGQIEVRDSA